MASVNYSAGKKGSPWGKEATTAGVTKWKFPGYIINNEHMDITGKYVDGRLKDETPADTKNRDCKMAKKLLSL